MEVSACFVVKNIGKPDAGELHVRFDEGGQGQTCSLLYPIGAEKSLNKVGSSSDIGFNISAVVGRVLSATLTSPVLLFQDRSKELVLLI